MITNDLTLLRWHIDRYDRLRASTASRAGVLLSAGALLSAANAVIITQLLGSRYERMAAGVLVIFGAATLLDTVLVVLALIQAAGVLTTSRESRETFAHLGPVPVSLVFNGSHTVRELRSFEEFSAAVDAQSPTDAVQAAKGELWVGIHQYRVRYEHLRRAVRLLRWAAVLLPMVLVGLVVISLIYR
jgi:hypothetical protein